MHLVFVEPRISGPHKRFVQAAVEIGATVSAIGEAPSASLDDDLDHWLTHYEQVGSVGDEAAVVRALAAVQARAHVDRIEAVAGPLMLPIARVRQAAGIPGTSVRTAALCRDPEALGALLRGAGVPWVPSATVATAAEAFAFAERIGYPLIVRSRERSGAIRVGAAGGMDAALGALGSGSVVIEQDAPGDHASYDAIAVGGAIAHEFVTHYDPSSLVATNRVDRAPAYRELRALGARVIELCGIETSAVHMAWVIGPRGAALRTVGCRPPGARLWDLYSAGNDLDLYREWALAVSGIRASQIASRRCAAGMVAVRPERAGHIAGYEGLEAIGNRFGEHLIDLHLPTPGTQVVPGAAGYLDHAWLRFKHTHDDALRRMLELVGRTVRMRVR